MLYWFGIIKLEHNIHPAHKEFNLFFNLNNFKKDFCFEIILLLKYEVIKPTWHSLGFEFLATWRKLEAIISIKNITATVAHSIEFNNKTITDPKAVINVFNNYFTSIAKKTNSNIKFSPKHYTDYLSYTNTNTFFLTPTDKNEISFIISSLDSHKSSGPNSIPVKILKLLKNGTS